MSHDGFLDVSKCFIDLLAFIDDLEGPDGRSASNYNPWFLPTSLPTYRTYTLGHKPLNHEFTIIEPGDALGEFGITKLGDELMLFGLGGFSAIILDMKPREQRTLLTKQYAICSNSGETILNLCVSFMHPRLSL